MIHVSCSIRLLSVAICAVLSASAASAADEAAPNATQLPQQVLPTGAEDVPQAAPAARSAFAAVSSESDQLVSELVQMTSESDAGLETVDLGDGIAMVDLQGRFMSVAVAMPTEDGTAVSCFTGHEAADQARHLHDVATGKAPQQAAKALTSPQTLEEK